MTPAIDNYSVLLRDDVHAGANQFLALLCETLTLPNGQKIPFLCCSEIDTTNPHYLAVTVHPPGSKEPWPLLIPHFMVLSIFGPNEGRNPIGFLQGSSERAK
jgi:hypothetical protein